jgi:hypothetical protein
MCNIAAVRSTALHVLCVLFCFVCFYGLDMLFKSDINACPVCPTYLSGHSLHFKRYVHSNLVSYCSGNSEVDLN